MSITRKDYELLASAIATAYADLLPAEIGRPGQDLIQAELTSLHNRVGARAVARKIADALADANPRFDRATFLDAAIPPPSL